MYRYLYLHIKIYLFVFDTHHLYLHVFIPTLFNLNHSLYFNLPTAIQQTSCRFQCETSNGAHMSVKSNTHALGYLLSCFAPRPLRYAKSKILFDLLWNSSLSWSQANPYARARSQMKCYVLLIYLTLVIRA